MMNEEGSLTARLCLFARAAHAEEQHPIFKDETAGKFISEADFKRFAAYAAQQFESSTESEHTNSYDSRRICRQVDCYLSPILMSRQAFAEQKLNDFAAQHHKIQYVILGAGMDTFAFRNQNPAIEIYELDHPYTQNFKKKRIQELGWHVPEQVHYASIDFSKDSIHDVLSHTAFQKDMPAYFSILGVSYYLRSNVLESLLKQTADEMKAGDQLVFDYPDETTYTTPGYTRAKRLSEIAASLGEVMTRGYALEEITQMLETSGLHVLMHLTPDMIQNIWFHDQPSMHAFQNVHFLLAEK